MFPLFAFSTCIAWVTDFNTKCHQNISGRQTVSIFKWGSQRWLIPNNGSCAVLNGTDGRRWWQPEDCNNKHEFVCLKEGNNSVGKQWKQ